MSGFVPHIVELPHRVDSVFAFRHLADQRNCVFLDSARPDSKLGRYSFVAADPFELIGDECDQPLESLNRRLQHFQADAVPHLPPFCGGAIGLWSYDLVRSLERIPLHRFDEFPIPNMFVGLYDVVLAFDHDQGTGWLISQGFPELQADRRTTRSVARANHFLELLKRSSIPISVAVDPTLNQQELAPSFSTGRPGVLSNYDRHGYQDTVQRVINYIYAGDAFQVNLAQRLITQANTDPVSLFMKLRECNAAPFAGYFDLGRHQIISASPERFLQVRERHVEARPIKGTRQRSFLPEADLFIGEALKASSKDLSENVMIVDLMRNDLSRVCRDDSVVVSQLCGLETYEFVQHLVSVVEGQLRDSVSPVELIAATFPGGSITGAPKVRAMEIIAELEPTARGPYCGSLGYIGFDGAMDMSILIRTITASRGWWQFPVGGGIVAQSDPKSEYEETWHKAEGLLRAIL